MKVLRKINLGPLLMLLSALVPGCASAARDVSYDRRYSGDYPVGKSFELIADATIIRQAADYWNTGTSFYLTTPRWVNTIVEYRHGDVSDGRLPAGTCLKIVRIMAKHSNPLPFYWLDLIRPIAVVCDGPRSNLVVDIAEISRHIADEGLHADRTAPSDKFLQPLSGCR